MRMCTLEPIPLRFAIMVTILAAGLRLVEGRTGAQVVLTAQDQSIAVNGETGRPLAEVLEQLERRHGWVITYEDARYEHPDDIDDVTAIVEGMVTSQSRC